MADDFPEGIEDFHREPHPPFVGDLQLTIGFPEIEILYQKFLDV